MTTGGNGESRGAQLRAAREAVARGDPGAQAALGALLLKFQAEDEATVAGGTLAIGGMSQSDYAKRLQAYLNNQIALGRMSPEQAASIWQTASIKVSGGTPLESLPYYNEPALRDIWLKPTTLTYPPVAAPKVTGAPHLDINRQPGETLLQTVQRLEGYVAKYRGGITTGAGATEREASAIYPVLLQLAHLKQAIGGEEGRAVEEGYPFATFEQERATLGGSAPWRTWFESKYSRELGRFRAVLSPHETLPGKSWAEFLKVREPELKEEFMSQSPYQRGERPSMYQPRIKTVGF